MSDFREFFHALHHAPSSNCQILICRPFEIELRELLIFKGIGGNTRFSPYLAFFLRIFLVNPKCFSGEILPKSQALSPGLYGSSLFSVLHTRLGPTSYHVLVTRGIIDAKPSYKYKLIFLKRKINLYWIHSGINKIAPLEPSCRVTVSGYRCVGAMYFSSFH